MTVNISRRGLLGMFAAGVGAAIVAPSILMPIKPSLVIPEAPKLIIPDGIRRRYVIGGKLLREYKDLKTGIVTRYPGEYVESARYLAGEDALKAALSVYYPGTAKVIERADALPAPDLLDHVRKSKTFDRVTEYGEVLTWNS
jgi:hypothetical protein